MRTAKTKLQSNLHERALAYLARRDHTALELKRKLLRLASGQENAPGDETKEAERQAEVDALIADFEKRGWLNEARYAEQVANAKRAKLGSLRIAHDLREKGVSEQLVMQTLAELQGDELTHAVEVHRKKYKSLPASREEWAKQARFLQSRGFGFDVIKQVLNRPNIDLDDQ